MTDETKILQMREVTTIFGSGATETYANKNVNLDIAT